MKVRCIYKESKYLKYNKVYDVLGEEDNMYIVQDESHDRACFYKWKFEEVKEMKELTFQEVIANIKDGEVWECTREDARVKEIKKNAEGENSLIVFKFGRALMGTAASIRGTDTFKLKRKKCTFEEAFKAYEEGKEIESIYTKYRYKKENELDLYTLEGEAWYQEDNFEIDEIRSKWYIND